MKRSPILHLALGVLVIFYAYIAGNLMRSQESQNYPITPDDIGVHTPQLPGVSRSYDIIVKYKDGTPQSLIQQLAKNFNATVLQNYSQLPGFSFETIQTTEALSIDQVIARLKADPNVEYAEPNFRYHTSAVPNDPYFKDLWGLSNTGQSIKGKPGVTGIDINALKAWDITTGSEDIVVGIVDTGIDYTHPDLSPNMWVNPGEIPNNGIDDDGNGVVDDVYGYNAVNNDGDPLDDNDHGSHCAGTIGAAADNNEGIVGVAWKVKLMGLKFLSADGSGSLNNALETINYALDMKKRGVNIRILSNSWGGGGYSQALYDAIKNLNKEGIVFVAAAGNSAANTDRYANYPSCYDVENVCAVAAINNQNTLASFSNYGAKTVDVAAPGVDVYSTVTGGGYEFFSGTSMATPHVSGVAALMLANNPKLTPKELIAKLVSSSQPTESLKGKVLANGRVDAFAALSK